MKRSLLFLASILAAVAAWAAPASGTPLPQDLKLATYSLSKTSKPETLTVSRFKPNILRLETAATRKLTLDERKQLLGGTVDMNLFMLYCASEEIRLTATEPEVDARIGEYKQRLGQAISDEQLGKLFISQGIPFDVRSYVRSSILFDKYLQKYKAEALKSAQVMATSDDVKKEYDLNKASLVQPDSVKITLIYVDLRPLSGADRTRVSSNFKQVAAQAREGSARFDEMVLKATDPGSQYQAVPSLFVAKVPQNQNNYGAIVMDKVFKLKAGEISEVIENEAGLQVVRVNEVIAQKQLSLSDSYLGQSTTVMEMLQQRITASKQATLLDQYQKELFADIRKRATITLFEDNLNF
ncbi:MAG: peptidyl-prolyl cis-trans isomerase [Rectinemataceae bacterium]